MESISYGGKPVFFRAKIFNVSTKTIWSVLFWLLLWFDLIIKRKLLTSSFIKIPSLFIDYSCWCHSRNTCITSLWRIYANESFCLVNRFPIVHLQYHSRYVMPKVLQEKMYGKCLHVFNQYIFCTIYKQKNSEFPRLYLIFSQVYIK